MSSNDTIIGEDYNKLLLVLLLVTVYTTTTIANYYLQPQHPDSNSTFFTPTIKLINWAQDTALAKPFTGCKHWIFCMNR